MTFRQSLSAVADRVLDRALGTVEAGACNPSTGHECRCTSIIGTVCWEISRFTQTQFSCHGQCNHVNSGACC